MKKLVLIAGVLAGLMFVATVDTQRPAYAGHTPTGTIAIAAGYTPALGEDLLFDYTEDLHTSQNPRIFVECYQGGVLVYGETRDAEPNSSINSQPFAPLGGGSSDWLTNGGPADCQATLFYWDFHPVQTFHPLATISFSAGG